MSLIVTGRWFESPVLVLRAVRACIAWEKRQDGLEKGPQDAGRSMKNCSRWMAILVALCCCQADLHAQDAQPYQPGADSGQAMPFQTELWSAAPGRLWAEFSFADRGLGYTGSYATLGGKTRLWDDFLDGRWLFEGQGHVSLESGGFFGNAGIERVFSISNAGADVVVGGWFDYDSDQQGNFAHTFTQFSVNAAIKTRQWDLVGNGYFPVGVDGYTQGDPTGVDCFFRSSIVLQAGIDSALKGFDATLKYRPAALGLVNGSVELGGYSYGSDLVDDFGGVKARMGIQLLRGLMIAGEINHDNRFDITSVVQVGWQFGMNARGSEYAGLGRDLEPTSRNDHIVRFQQDVILAIDPDTGAPYNIFHVDNLADAAFGNGTVETPFATLLEAQAASGPDDIIFVREGDGTTRNYANGIVLNDGQMLLGDGVRHLIPIQNGQIFQLCNDLDGLRPHLANDGGNVVTLANRNTVRGVIIDGNGLAVNGISGNTFPFGPPITDGVIEDTTINDPILNGILLNNIAGDWRFARNDISGALVGDGISILNACDPTSVFTFEDNIVNANARDGIHMKDFDGTTFTFTRNTTNGNGRDGVHLEDYKNMAGLGGEFRLASPTSSGNTRHGISMENVDGNVQILNPDIQGNLGNGIDLVNVTNTQPGDRTFIGPTLGGTSSINGNSIGVHVRLDQPGEIQDVTITNSTINNSSLMGILSEASGTGVQLTTNVVDNISVSGSGGSGMRFTSMQGAFHRVLVENQFAPLIMNGNGAVTGNGIDLLVGDNSPGLISSMDATIRNVNITNTGGVGIFTDVELDGQLTLFTENVNITNSAVGILSIFDTNATGALSRAIFNNVNVTNVGGDGVRVDVRDDSLVDIAFTNGLIRDNDNAAVPEPNHGFHVSVDGAGALARVLLQNTTISNLTPALFGFEEEGVLFQASGGSRTLATLDGNTILNNGAGADPANLPYFDGINVVMDVGLPPTASTFSLNLTNNTIVGNFEHSFNLNNAGSGVANIFMFGNTCDSDFGEDAPVPITSNLEDMRVTNGAMATTCLAMSNNFFASPAVVENLAAAVSFTLELDGLSNGLGQPVILGGPAAVTIVPFGSACQPAISAEEAFFILNGFPPP